MKRVSRTEDGKLVLSEQPLCELGSDELLLKVQSFRISGEDLLSQSPEVGTTAIGKVVKKGDNVSTGYDEDSIVIALTRYGSASEYITIESHLCCELPLSLQSSKALLSSVVCSYYLLITQTLKLCPVGCVVAVSTGNDRETIVELCSSLGINVIPIGASFNEVMELTSGLGVSAAICLPSYVLEPDEMMSLARLVSPRGKFILQGGQAPDSSLFSSPLIDIISVKSASLVFHSLSSWLLAPADDGIVSHVLIEAIRLLSKSNSFQTPPTVSFQNFSSELDCCNKPLSVTM